MEIQQGDLIYIKENAIDIRSGKRMTNGDPYSVGSRVRCKIQLIDYFNTHGKYHLPVHVTRVKCVNNLEETVWEIQPKDVDDDIIRFSEKYQTKADPPKYVEPTTVEGRTKLNISGEGMVKKMNRSNTGLSDWKSNIRSKPYIPSPFESGKNKNKTVNGNYNSKFITTVTGTSHIGENNKVTYREVEY